jgi:nickel/cobalt transporter (NicO) family protein
VTEAGLTFPPGVGGLSTMRLVCGYEAALATPLTGGAVITYADGTFSDRLGWREIVTSGSGVTLAEKGGGAMRTSSTSARLTHYPTNLLTQALADRSVAIVATPGGPTLAAFEIPDASPLTGAPGAVTATVAPAGSAGDASSGPVAVAGPASTAAPAVAASTGSVPGGVTSGDLPSIFRTADLSPIVLLVSILTAAALGAGHALTPGHGKTLMAAYLVGTRGTALHAAGLGLSVTLSHTIGILVLAGLVVGAQGVLPPDLVVKTAPFVAAISIVVIGGWMLFSEGRRRWRIRAADANHVRAHAHGEAHAHDEAHEDPVEAHEHDPATRAYDHDHGMTIERDRAVVHAHDSDSAAGHAHAAHDQEGAARHDHESAHDHQPALHDHDQPARGEHSHGGVRHTHLPPAGSTISWRSLFVLGLAGGLIPSASALLILLGSIAAGRPAFGFVLVVAFGLGMALVMSGIGLALVLARGRLERVDSASTLGSVSRSLPLVASLLVFSLGIYLTVQAVAGTTTF